MLLHAAETMDSRIESAELASQLRSQRPAILASILASDFGRLRDEIEAAEAAGVAAIHVDVMDGHFVPNISFGIPILEAVRRTTDLPVDVHLMISNPAKYVDAFRKAGADNITIHIEAVPEPRPLLEKIRSLGAGAGLAFNPPTPLAAIESSIPFCDLILVMSVMPGFGGQKFDRVALDKLRQLRAASDDLVLEIDGGVNTKTIAECAAAGAQWFVTGSAIFEGDDYRARVKELAALAEQGHVESGSRS
jgi:ribulose-phosphate 3-epimerase